MIRKQKKLFFILALFVLVAWLLIADPVNLSLIDTEETLVGPVTKGDFLTIFPVFGTIVTVAMFLLTGRWRTSK